MAALPWFMQELRRLRGAFSYPENSKAPLGKITPPANCKVNVIESGLYHSDGQPGRAATHLPQLWGSCVGPLLSGENIFIPCLFGP